MSELAFNMNGEPFDVPATATGWRVRRMKTKGAPEVVYSREGTPLMLPIDAGIDDLRNAVGAAGRYRIDPVDEHRPIPNAQAGYVFLHDETPVGSTAASSTALPPRTDNIVIEALRMNAEITKTIVERFAQVMEASAIVLRAADGAGLPAREPRASDDETDEDDDDGQSAQGGSPTFELINQLVAQIVPVIVTSLATKGMPKLGAILDWRKAIPESTNAAAAPSESATHVEPLATEHPPIDPATLAKVMAVQAQLTPAEAALARQLGAQLSPAELRAFFDQLASLSVPDAVAKVRSLIGASS